MPNNCDEMNEQMVLCESQYKLMNDDYKNYLNINIMKCSNIITYEGNIDLSQMTGNNNEICYMVNIVPLFHYLCIIQPQYERKLIFSKDSIFTQSSNQSTPWTFPSKPSSVFGTSEQNMIQ